MNTATVQATYDYYDGILVFDAEDDETGRRYLASAIEDGPGGESRYAAVPVSPEGIVRYRLSETDLRDAMLEFPDEAFYIAVPLKSGAMAVELRDQNSKVKDNLDLLPAAGVWQERTPARDRTLRQSRTVHRIIMHLEHNIEDAAAAADFLLLLQRMLRECWPMPDTGYSPKPEDGEPMHIKELAGNCVYLESGRLPGMLGFDLLAKGMERMDLILGGAAVHIGEHERPFRESVARLKDFIRSKGIEASYSWSHPEMAESRKCKIKA